MINGQWLVKSGGKKVQAPSLGLKISIPKFDNSNLIAEYSKTVIGRCMNPSKQDPSMLSYKGAVESQGRVSGGAVDGNNRRNGQQVPRNNEYKGKGIAYDNNSYDGFKKPGFKRSYGDQDGAQSRNMRQSGRLSHTEAPAGYAMATSGLSKLDSQDVGQHLDHQQNLMMDAFRSGKSGERNQSSVSKARKALTFEGNSSGMALKGLEGEDDAIMEEAETKGLEKTTLIPDPLEAAVVEAKMVGGDMEREGKEEGEKEGLIEEVETEGVVLELTEDVASTEGVEEGGADQLGDVIPTEEDFDVEEENQLMETESQEVRMVNEGKECPVNRKKLGKTSGAVMEGTLKKRLVQSIVSPRKKHTAKQGSKMGEKGALPPKKASVKPDPDQD
ncbi:hypothetical protein HID58_006316 [Brassica napus]|uniref:Uncharacterized protein n=1 Tax=Brassica napus TaxID=3708 RepID=A0ABQ8EB30_BRANA|nr:hypothetical protein HID58_006316 [Brassica napus]